MKALIPQPAKNLYHLVVAFFAAVWFRFPARKLKIVGITGTDGKTTTVNLVYHILNSSGVKVGMISTVSAKIGEKTYETGFHVTTPSAFTIQKYLRKMVDEGTEYAVLEVTSHGLDQHRVAFIPFFIGLITNITPEHLDYHRSFKNYVLAKAKILHKVKYRVLNAEESVFEKLKMMGSGQLVAFGGLNTDYFGEVVSSYDNLSNFAIHYKTKQKQLKTLVVQSNLIGEFNLLNILASFAVSKIFGLEDKKIINAISHFGGVEGRMQEISLGQAFKVYIDFAHTPKSIELALETLRKVTQKKLLVVFGAAGERDPSKRVLMGQVAAQKADLIILTAEDPRSEDPAKINSQIAKGIEKEGGKLNSKYWKVVDRSQAISQAIGNLAQEGDTVAILGKGHEKTINLAGKEYPWSDQAQVEKALKQRLGQL
ncbi:MAG TPA: UDP-N-acetylmuramoyl-L-alanyl-D-glutamate--2,6-diaminopimelate ligase [Candidatus Saccharimonadales bacterium]|nr:UDP-N-acetylmuramoyl-L-alanyl-D-glutamate--2,6-diaminopimelate ligase [Candidatus Saccharimonadales bacterium]